MSGPHVKLVCKSERHHITFVSKAEIGIGTRSLSSRPEIKPRVRMNVFRSDGLCCLVCARVAQPGRELVVGHIISVKDAEAAGWPESQTYSEENLAAMCEECNAGLGSTSLDPARVAQVRAQRWGSQ
jgi:5-methylcytosine-specific restriction endonuclease McrA